MKTEKAIWWKQNSVPWNWSKSVKIILMNYQSVLANLYFCFVIPICVVRLITLWYLSHFVTTLIISSSARTIRNQLQHSIEMKRGKTEFYLKFWNLCWIVGSSLLSISPFIIRFGSIIMFPKRSLKNILFLLCFFIFFFFFFSGTFLSGYVLRNYSRDQYETFQDDSLAFEMFQTIVIFFLKKHARACTCVWKFAHKNVRN
jgi:hypothetical protein